MGSTSSDRAKIVATAVVMVEVHQDLSGLIQTGFNRVPFDQSSEEIVVWTADSTDRIADGTVRITADGTAYDVKVMDDATDDGLGVFDSTYVDASGYSFLPTEAGFKMLLHARLVPVNTDSFGSKKLVVTMQVQYEAIGNTGRRRRLVSSEAALASRTDGQASVTASIQAWRPMSLPAGLSTSASMRLEMSVPAGSVLRDSAARFAASLKQALLNGLNGDALSTKAVYDNQVSIDSIMANQVPIWSRVQYQAISSASRRRLPGGAQTLSIEFTFAEVSRTNSMELYEMIQVLDRQLKSPASSLLAEPIFAQAVIHTLEEIPTSSYTPPTTPTKLASSASTFGLLASFLLSLVTALL